MSSPLVLEVLAHFHGGPLDRPGVTRVLPAGQREYVFVDDLLQRTGQYRRCDGSDCCCQGSEACYVWSGWAA